MSTLTVLGVYTSGGDAARAVEAVRQRKVGTVTTYSPTADHAILDAVRPRSSPPSAVRAFTLAGGVIGCAIGIALPVYTMLDWPLIVGGKPIISIPPLVVIGFELAMLGAALTGFLGFLVLSGLPNARERKIARHRFTDDRFGVAVTCTSEHQAAVRDLLEQAGAEEVSGDE